MRTRVNFTVPGSPVARELIYDHAERKLIEHAQQDVEPILVLNKALLNAERSTTSLWGDRTLVKVASVPMALLEKWGQEEGLWYWDKEAMPKILARLSSREYEHLRTAPGRLA